MASEMKEVELYRIVHSDQSPECQMYLRERGGRRVFPVIIAMNEMAEIHRKVHGIATRRPMTHDIFRGLVDAVGAKLEAVEITELKEDVFYASMRLLLPDGRRVDLDARPSDAVAIATGCGAKLYAAERILQDIGIVEAESSPESPRSRDEDDDADDEQHESGGAGN